MSMPIPLSTYSGRETWRKVLKDEERAEKSCTCFFEKHGRDLALLAFDELDTMQTRAMEAERQTVIVKSHRYILAHALAVKCHQKIVPGANDRMYPEQFVTVEDWLDWVSRKDPCFICEHWLNPDGGWCYMFKEKPETIPCGQYHKVGE